MTSAAASQSALPGGGSGGIPRHVAIIMDGNGRWAKQRHLPRLAGHKAGVEAVRGTVRAASALGIEALTLYAFSSENWRRPEGEIRDLMGLLRFYLKAEIQALIDNGVRLRIIGDYGRFGVDLRAMMDDAVARTAANTRITVAVALNYGSQAELAAVARSLAEDVRDGRLDPAQIDEAAIEARLDTCDLPPLDLLIRTSGEVRLSNFLLWQAAYAELVFVDTLWPDFDAAALDAAVAAYARRDRRFGGA